MAFRASLHCLPQSYRSGAAALGAILAGTERCRKGATLRLDEHERPRAGMESWLKSQLPGPIVEKAAATWPPPGGDCEGLRYQARERRSSGSSGEPLARWAAATEALDLVWGCLGRGDRRIVNAVLRLLDEKSANVERLGALDELGLDFGGDEESIASKREAHLPEALRKGAEVLLPHVNELLKKGCDSRNRDLNAVGRQRLRALQFQLESVKKDLTMANVSGHAKLKQDLEESVVWPHRRPDIFSSLRQPPQGILLYGPPGNGKTMVAEALANSLGVPFYQVRVSDMISKYSGDSEKNISALCEAAREEAEGAVVFVDEIDSLASSRDAHGTHAHEARATNELLMQMDSATRSAGGQGGRVIFVAATNRPWSLDAALMRRLPRVFFLGPPDFVERQDFLSSRFLDPASGLRCSLSVVDLEACAQLTEGLSYAALDGVLREACAAPVREAISKGMSIAALQLDDIPPVELRHVEGAAERLLSSVGGSTRALPQWSKWSEGGIGGSLVGDQVGAALNCQCPCCAARWFAALAEPAPEAAPRQDGNSNVGVGVSGCRLVRRAAPGDA